MQINKMNNEIWKDIPEYEGLYWASNCGNIKSRRRERAKGGILKPSKTGPRKNYLVVCLYKNKKPKQYKVHKLILETFVGPCPPGMECRHLDGNPLNNRLENLKWGTSQENSDDIKRHGRSTVNKTIRMGINHPASKFFDNDVRKIKKLYLKGWTLKELSIKFEVGITAIWSIVHNKTWKHIK
jgi:hypothetical protein